MRTQEFLRIEAMRLCDEFIPHTHARGATRYFSSVLCDGSALYSFGTHYPLFWYITGANGKRYSVKNIQGYSNTTAKHISHAPSADIYVKLWRDDTGWGNPFLQDVTVIKALQRELHALIAEMNTKKRKNTQVYAILQSRHDEIIASIAMIV